MFFSRHAVVPMQCADVLICLLLSRHSPCFCIEKNALIFFAFWPESMNLCCLCLSVGETLCWITAIYSLSISLSLLPLSCMHAHFGSLALSVCLSVLQMLIFNNTQIPEQIGSSNINHPFSYCDQWRRLAHGIQAASLGS